MTFFSTCRSHPLVFSINNLVERNPLRKRPLNPPQYIYISVPHHHIMTTTRKLIIIREKRLSKSSVCPTRPSFKFHLLRRLYLTSADLPCVIFTTNHKLLQLHQPLVDINELLRQSTADIESSPPRRRAIIQKKTCTIRTSFIHGDAGLIPRYSCTFNQYRLRNSSMQPAPRPDHPSYT